MTPASQRHTLIRRLLLLPRYEGKITLSIELVQSAMHHDRHVLRRVAQAGLGNHQASQIAPDIREQVLIRSSDAQCAAPQLTLIRVVTAGYGAGLRGGNWAMAGLSPAQLLETAVVTADVPPVAYAMVPTLAFTVNPCVPAMVVAIISPPVES